MEILDRLKRFVKVRNLKKQLGSIEEELSSLEHFAFVAEKDNTQPWNKLNARHKKLLSDKIKLELLIRIEQGLNHK